MQRLSKIITLIIFVFGVVPISAQFVDQAKLDNVQSNYGFGMKPVKSPFSLIDFSKIKWSNSYSVSFFSGGNNSSTSGLFNSTMFYEFSSKLSMAVNLGISHNAGSILNSNSTDANFLPGFSLDYHPSKHFNFRIDYRTVDNSYFYSPYLYRSRHIQDR